MSKIVLKIEFESEKDLNKWVGWYFDGGGEQEACFFVDKYDREKRKMSLIKGQRLDDHA